MQSPAADRLLAEALAGLTAADLWAYPDQHFLRDLALEYGLGEDRILLSGGSTAAIGAIVEGLAMPRGALILQEPSFAAWSHFAKLRGVRARRCQGVDGNPPKPTTERFTNALTSVSPAVAVINNPGNPLGDLIPFASLREMACIAAEHGHLLVIDDCYGEFAGTQHLQLVTEFDNVVVIRSMSKAWGLAGARLAMVFAPSALIDYLQLLRLDSTVSAPALTVAARLLSEKSRLAAVRDEIVATREWFVAQIHTVKPDWIALPSVTNFVTLSTGIPGEADRITEVLADNGIRVRSLEAETGLAGCVRMSVAGREDLSRVLEVLRLDPTQASGQVHCAV